jgi:hypothetical protein
MAEDSKKWKDNAVGALTADPQHPSTAATFYFWVVDDNSTVGLNTIVSVRQEEQGSEPVYSLVEEIRFFKDIDGPLTDKLSKRGDPAVDPPTKPHSTILCKAKVLAGESLRPIMTGNVHYPTEEGLMEALQVGQGDIPVGVFENSDGETIPVTLSESFILGPDGAHANITGMAGLAGKTTKLLVDIAALRQHSRAKVAVVLFNLKGDDLLWIDRPNPYLRDYDRNLYKRMQVPAEPFAGAKFFAVLDPQTEEVRSYRKSATPFYWNYDMVRDYVARTLEPEDYDDKILTALSTIREVAARKGYKGIREVITEIETETDKIAENRPWLGTFKATWWKARRVLEGLRVNTGGLVTEGREGQDLPFEKLSEGNVWVIDLAQLPHPAQRLAFTRVLDRLHRLLESRKAQVERIVVFIDELNKYAPKETNVSSDLLKKTIVDISERGRSSGLILFSAQQFGSQVEPRVLGNIAYVSYGKMKATELEHSFYKHLPEQLKERITQLKAGQHVLDAHELSAPLMLRYPDAPCLTGSTYGRWQQERTLEKTDFSEDIRPQIDEFEERIRRYLLPITDKDTTRLAGMLTAIEKDSQIGQLLRNLRMVQEMTPAHRFDLAEAIKESQQEEVEVPF